VGLLAFNAFARLDALDNNDATTRWHGLASVWLNAWPFN
jgi:hypothetical protein